MLDLGRREFISLLGGAAAAWPLGVNAQQPALPVIGFLDTRSPDAVAGRLRALRQGLTTAKRLELLRDLVPAADRMAVLVNPANVPTTDATLRDVASAAHAIGLRVQVFNASTSREIDATFATFGRERPNAVFVGIDQFLISRRVQLVNLASRHALPATFPDREFPEIGGLMSYGASIPDAYRQIGIYVGRVLKGAKPADLPVAQASKLELVINAQTARMLDLTLPDKLLSLADEVIE
jgi:putative tryptophan/tyrosine transport system substrate-binding protein